MTKLPEGTVSFLFTDIEGSTRLLSRHPSDYARALLRHDEIMRAAIARYGVIFETIGDAVYAAFDTPAEAVRAALDAQLGLSSESWGELPPLRARMAVNRGEVERRGSHYFGAVLYRSARLLTLGHGGQTLLPRSVVELVQDALPATASLRRLGMFRLKDIAAPEEVFQLDHPSLRSDFPPLRALDPLATNLPVPATSFIGRARERAELEAMLGSARIVTLTGPGGVGKTRLAIQVASDSIANFDDGVWYVPLAGLADPALVPSALAHALGLKEHTGDLLDALKELVRGKELLLVVDNIEHVVASAPVLAALLATSPKLKMLATSRVPLHVAGERQFAVPPLGVAAGSDAITLFVRSALAAQPHLSLDSASLAIIERICSRIDGLPLAIELAASRTKLLPLDAILARLDQPLSLLEGGTIDVPVHQRGLRATIAWSYGLLDASEQELFAALAVFVVGFSLEAAEAVIQLGAERTLADLNALVEHSLLRSDTLADGEPRFSMLETIRDYAWSRLQPAAFGPLRERHARYFLALADRGNAELHGTSALSWLQRLDADQENLRSALSWLDETRQPVLIARAAIALRMYWWLGGRSREGLRWLDAALIHEPELPPTLRAEVLRARGILALITGDAEAGRAYRQRALAIREELGDEAAIAESLSDLSDAAYQVRDYATAESYLTRSLEIRLRLGLHAGAADDRDGLGILARDTGNMERASDLLEEALRHARDGRDRNRLAGSLLMLGELSYMKGELDRADALLTESVDVSRTCGSSSGVAVGLANRTIVAVAGGRLPEATVLCTEAFRASADSDAVRVFVACLVAAAAVTAAIGDARGAGRLLGASESLGAFALGPFAIARDRAIATAVTLVPSEAFDAAVAEGRSLDRRDALAEALTRIHAVSD